MELASTKELSPRQMRQVIYALAFPIVGTNLLLRGVGIVDTAMVGHISAEAQAAVGMSQWITQFMMAFMQAIGMGGTISVAALTGARDEKGRLLAADTAIWAGLVMAIVMSLLGLFFTEKLAILMGADFELFERVYDYMSIISAMFLGKGMIQVTSGIFNGIGDTKTPFRVIVGVNIVHILLAYPLTFGVWGMPKMEIVGVAMATGISELMGAVVLILLAHKKGLISLKSFSKYRLGKIFGLGSPVLGERVSTTIMQMVYTSMVLKTAVSAFAAHSVGLVIESISWLPGFGFAQATTTLVGQNIGANQPNKAKKFSNQALIIAVILMGSVGLTFLLFPQLWMKIFSNDPDVIRYGIMLCRITAFIQIPLSFTMILAGSLRGAGETTWVMFSTIIGGWLIRLPLAYLLGIYLNLGIIYIWIAMPIDWAIRAGVLYIRYSREKWDNSIVKIT